VRVTKPAVRAGNVTRIELSVRVTKLAPTAGNVTRVAGSRGDVGATDLGRARRALAPRRRAK